MTPLRLHSPSPSRLAIDRAPRAARRVTRGFVLIGVVIMVLALTILGLSLFSLSSFEAQFLNQSLDGSQALASAMGGLDRARFTLTVPPQNLSQVTDNLTYENVIYARAEQLKPGSPPVVDTAGIMIAGGSDVQITVTARYRNSTCTVTGSYEPKVQINYYKRLLTVPPGGIQVNKKVAGYDACGTVLLGTVSVPDSVWEGDPTSPGMDCAATQNSTFWINRRFVPTPSVTEFFSTHTGTAVPYNSSTYTFAGSPKQVKFYTTDDLTSSEFSSRNGALTINVTGYAVWMLPRGLRTDGFTHITGDPSTSCLVIVAHNGIDLAFQDVGAVWLFEGLQADIPVIFVTDGAVKIEEFGTPGGGTTAAHLSIFAQSVLLTGPTTDPTVNTQGNRMRLSYGTHDLMDPVIDALMAADALPNSVSNTPFALRPGTWRVVQ